jgi:hypothetical protein
MADIRMRSEQMDRTKRDCVKRHKAGSLIDFDPMKPWDVVYREAAIDHEFWGTEVDKKVLQHITSLASPAQLVDDGYGVLEEAPNALNGHKGGGNSGGGKKRRARSSSSASPVRKRRPGNLRGGGNPQPKKDPKEDSKGKGKKGKGKGAGKNETVQGADGRYVKFNGTQVCFAWNKGGCSAICPHGRAHVCEKCTERHRPSECTAVPNVA